MHVLSELAGDFGLRLHGVKQALKAPGLLPTGDAARHGAPGIIVLRHVAPGGAGTEHPQHAIAEATMVDRWWSPPELLGWQQRLESLPWGVGEVSPVPRTLSHTEHGRGGKDSLVRAIVSTTDQVVEHVFAPGKLLVGSVGHYYGDDIHYMGSGGPPFTNGLRFAQQRLHFIDSQTVPRVPP
jgi:hypothetical protein